MNLKLRLLFFTLVLIIITFRVRAQGLSRAEFEGLFKSIATELRYEYGIGTDMREGNVDYNSDKKCLKLINQVTSFYIKFNGISTDNSKEFWTITYDAKLLNCFSKTFWAFMILHEIGHGEKNLPGSVTCFKPELNPDIFKKANKQEKDADIYAAENWEKISEKLELGGIEKVLSEFKSNPNISKATCGCYDSVKDRVIAIGTAAK